jgi:hypothetical protein
LSSTFRHLSTKTNPVHYTFKLLQSNHHWLQRIRRVSPSFIHTKKLFKVECSIPPESPQCLTKDPRTSRMIVLSGSASDNRRDESRTVMVMVMVTMTMTMTKVSDWLFHPVLTMNCWTRCTKDNRDNENSIGCSKVSQCVTQNAVPSEDGWAQAQVIGSDFCRE